MTHVLSILTSLETSLRAVPYVGPKTLERLQKLVGTSYIDVLWHFPDRIETRLHVTDLTKTPLKTPVTVIMEVVQHCTPSRPRMPYKVVGKVGCTLITLVFFRPRVAYLQNALSIGSKRLISGSMERGQEGYQMAHPDHMGMPSELSRWVGVRPLYGLTGGLSQSLYHGVRDTVLASLRPLPEWIPLSLLKENSWVSWEASLRQIHAPQSLADLHPLTSARSRIAFDELLAHQLSLKLLKRHHTIEQGRRLEATGTLTKHLLNRLPFSLTPDQETVLKTIAEDMRSPHRMMRLLQGDVGSGKTIVALFALLHGIEAGTQGALLAPTELLAQQLYDTVVGFLGDLPVKVGLFLGRHTAKERREVQSQLTNGTLHLAIGTHALLESAVQFHNLGLVIIDEQHRFGVEQRKRLIDKGERADVLLMSATPIPRSLALTAYGDLSLCILGTKPLGRQPILTRALPMKRIDEIYAGLERLLSRQEKVYWVCPLIEESETLDLGHAENRYKELVDRFGSHRVGLIHGRIKADEQDRVMDAFKNGTIDILVATSIIEVGLHVEQASCIVIENAERFGLSQLHQLRGRVGRGSQTASCLLLYDQLPGHAKERLKTLCTSSNGFYIAEQDLKLRGGGDLLGSKQSGFPTFRTVTFPDHEALVAPTDAVAQQIIDQDPFLREEAHQPLRVLLRLFRKERVLGML